MTTLELPSGLIGDVRKIRGVEMSAIAEQADGGGDAEGGFSELLNACWLSTSETGPYPHVRTGDVKPDWKRIVKGDILVGTVFLRRISLPDGNTFEFEVPCEECGKKWSGSVDLSKLSVRKLSAEARDRLSRQAAFEVDIPGCGCKARFNLATIAQEAPIIRLMKQTKRTRTTPVDTICAQITSIDGVKDDIKSRWRFLSELSMGELIELREAMDAQDCGIDTAIDIRCTNPACRWEQTINIPLLGRRFFSLKKRRKTEEDDLDEEPTTSGESSSEASPASGGGSGALTSGGTSMGGAATGG